MKNVHFRAVKDSRLKCENPEVRLARRMRRVRVEEFGRVPGLESAGDLVFHKRAAHHRQRVRSIVCSRARVPYISPFAVMCLFNHTHKGG